MSSSILRLRNLGRLKAHFSKLEATHSYGNLQRTLCTNCALCSSVTKQFLIHDLRETSQAGKNSDFGKVVDLDCSFDELRLDDKFTKRVGSESKRISKNRKKKELQFKEEKQLELAKASLGVEKEFIDVSEECEENKIDETECELEIPNEEKQKFRLLKDNSGLFSNLLLKLKSKKWRNLKREIVLEGKRLIQDALTAGHTPLKIFFSRFSDLRMLNLPEDVEVIQVPYKSLSVWSDVVTSQGVIGIFQMPALDTGKGQVVAVPLTVICDNIRDPGNMGTIMRVISAVGCKELILTTGCVDIWEPKVLRAGAGAHFRLPVTKSLNWPDLEDEIPEGTQIILADNKISENSSEISESNKDQEDGQIKRRAFETSSEFASNLPVYCYTSFQYDPSGAVIIVGGETHGLSDEAYQFAMKRNGSRVNLPMHNGTESLNSAIALAIFSYEFRRQVSAAVGQTSPEVTIETHEESKIEKLQ